MITFKHGLFYAEQPKGEKKAVMLKLGWRPDKRTGLWKTSKLSVAAKTPQKAAGAAKDKLEAYRDEIREAIGPSLAHDSKLIIPAPPGFEYRDFQKAAIAFADTKPDTLIADPPGTGKTIIAMGVINRIDGFIGALIICPASGKNHWKNHHEDWCTHPDISVDIAEGDFLPDTDTVIINYELAERHAEALRRRKFSIIVIDEEHYLKNGKAKRTVYIYGGTLGKGRDAKKVTALKADKNLYLTGTPIYTRPIDIWTICKRCDPERLGSNWWKFVHRYCDAKHTGFGLDTSGASHLDELQIAMRSRFMMRRKKKDIMAELPPKTHQIVELPSKGLKKLIESERSLILSRLEAYEKQFGLSTEQTSELMSDALRYLEGEEFADQADVLVSGQVEEFAEISGARQELAIRKVPMIVDFAKNILDQVEDKIIIFCYHKAVAREIAEAFGDEACLIIGSTPVKKRQGIVDDFQTNPAKRIMVANFLAGGTVFTMTAASTVILAELSWIPSELEQAIDRAWRYGQLNAVLAYWLVVEGSLDAYMIETLVERVKEIEAALEYDENEHIPALADRE